MPGPLPPNPTTTVETASQDAVMAGVASAPAQTIAGTRQAASQTTPGALGTTVAQNGAFAGINAVNTHSPESVGVSWIVCLWFQGLKHNKHINQDTQKWFWLLLIAFVFGAFTYWALAPDHDIIQALGKAMANSGITAANAIANYHSVKPLNWFGSAAEMQGG
jgi:hypothetical protein